MLPGLLSQRAAPASDRLVDPRDLLLDPRDLLGRARRLLPEGPALGRVSSVRSSSSDRLGLRSVAMLSGAAQPSD